MVTRDVMRKVVKCCRDAKRMSDELQKNNGDGEMEEFCFTLYGELLDSIYFMLRECTTEVTDSLTMTVLNSNMTDTDCANVLFAVMKARENIVPPAFLHPRKNQNIRVGYKYKAGAEA